MSRGNTLPMGLIVAGILLVASNLRAAITTVGPVLSSVEEDLGLSASAASVLVSLPLLCFAVVSPLIPRLATRWGLERVIVSGLVLLAVGLLVRSTPPQMLLWAGTVMIGVSIAALNVVLPALVKRDVPGRIGQVTGAYSAMQSGFAAVAAGVAVPVAGLTSLGWRLPLGMWAGLALVTIGVLLPRLRVGGHAPRRGAAAPADRHLERSGAALAPVAPVARAARSVWRQRLAWQVTVFMGLQSTSYYVLVTWLPAIEVDAGVGDTAAGVHQFLLHVFGIVGSLGCSALIARTADQRVLGVVVPLTMLAAVTGMLLAPSVMVLWVCLAGVGCGSSIVLALSFFGLRTRDHGQAASLSGMAQSVGYLLAAAGPVAVGALHDVSGSWTPALVVLIVADVLLVAVGWRVGRDRTLD
ncbi:MFS transporter [Corynebacterium sp.]|uniref:MFS transporter n=1 Tax=Corynebacterium sp. TaxID=1720 RepID=UPI0026490170|nr:MFS transporter [Corynebacterium sp.]MDN5719444.1 MFS transporter [Corynebacterium sp.]